MMIPTPHPRHRTRLAAAMVALALPAAAIAAPAAHASDDATSDAQLVVGKVGLNDIPHMNPLDSGWVVQGEF
ncbi:hypothetical protein, partial [Phytoactinopolyspora endophytica]|uniref:hypothetical protein n=1 Tax=Phytoactinopolyspora endophytica TaxID=1642495 RepID=UPI0013ED5A14